MNFIRTAIDNGDLKSIQEAKEDFNHPLYLHLAYALHKKQFDIANYIESKYLNKMHPIWDQCAENAAQNGHINVVKYAESKGACLIYAGGIAAENGHFEIFKYIVSKRHVDWIYYLRSAERGDHREIVEYCKINGKDSFVHFGIYS